ncbi:sialin [Caerostris extrusa]|uniref:Sialin n=1 Tax=Caerostris extrusa TaxID=172846 RepID=A0AAV4XC10_CAEEX|nr:sialin [Caerostris extrusa]
MVKLSWLVWARVLVGFMHVVQVFRHPHVKNRFIGKQNPRLKFVLFAPCPFKYQRVNIMSPSSCRFPDTTSYVKAVCQGLTDCKWFNVTHVDMSPELAGILYGMTNTLASLNGIICPTIAGYFLISGPTIANWNKVFYITSAMFIVPGIIFHLFASAEKQSWGLTTEKDSKCEVTKF